MLTALVVLFHLLGFFASIDAVMTARTAQGAIAWGVSLNTFPYLAFPMYLVLGRRSFEGYVESWQARQDEVKHFHEQMAASLAPYAVETFERIPNYVAMKRLAQSPLLRGNEVDLLIDGEATFESLFAGLARAERYALVQFYIIHDDGLGRRLKAALLDCAARGVAVYLLYDEVGSSGLPASYLEELEAAGIHQSKFNTTQGAHNRFQLNFRNHRKNVVVDGRETWIGGHNVGDEYLGLDPKVGPWRDTHVRIEGPAAQVAQKMFLADWYWATRTVPDLDWEPKVAASGADLQAMVLAISPTDVVETAQLFFVHALNAAKERIWIASPYFVPDDAVMAALRLAALRGVDVRVIVPEKSDNPLVDAACRWYARELAGAGIRFFRYGAGFPHQKVLLIDRDIGSIGSPNFDNRSFRLQFEINAIVVDEGFGNQVEAMLRADLARSEAWNPSDLAGAPFVRRLWVSFARLTAPIL
ncbi:MAG: cardiolipin synthase [Acidobacteria bacterium]|nr:cardiolipin synthase [Acidobacteriota bacterium]